MDDTSPKSRAQEMLLTDVVLAVLFLQLQPATHESRYFDIRVAF